MCQETKDYFDTFAGKVKGLTLALNSFGASNFHSTGGTIIKGRS